MSLLKRQNVDDMPFDERCRTSHTYRTKHAGYGVCARCRMPWAVVTSKSVPHDFFEDGTERGGGFAICQPCWNELGTAEARFPYYRQLAYKWATQGLDDPIELSRIFKEQIERMSAEES